MDLFNKSKEQKDINKQYIIDTSKLQKGDIIFSTSFSRLSKSIRYFTKSDFSHVMLYVDDNSIIHANGLGVHAYNTQRMCFDNKNN